MPTVLTYGTYSFVPVPDISISTEIQRSDAGYGIGTVDKITLNGVLYASGSEINRSGTIKSKSSINNLMIQLSGLQKAVQQDYQELVLECSSDIYRSAKARTVVDNFAFENSSDEQWLQIINYTVNLSVYKTGFINYVQDSGYLVSNFTNTYNITTNDNNAFYNGSQFKSLGLSFPSYTITREISAQGIQSENTSALDNAIRCVSGLAANSNIGFDQLLNGLYIYDRSTEISKDSINGSYSIRDTFAAYSGTSGWADTYTITSSIDGGLQRSVEIAGQVEGFASYPATNNLYSKSLNDSFSTANSWEGYGSTKWLAASGGFFNHVRPNIFGRVLSSWIGNTGLYKAIISSGRYPFNTGINPLPASISVDHNISEGSISYNYNYNSRPLSMITGAINESIDLNDNYALRTYSFPDIFYRMPLAQDQGTYSNSKRSVTYSATFPRPFLPNRMTTDLKDKIQQVMDQFNPSGLALRITNDPGRGPKYFSWVTENSENFDILGGKYTKTIAWEYQKGYI